VKPILRAEYIYDTFQLALDAAVDTSGISGAVPHLPDRRKYLVNKGIGGGEALKRTRSVTRDDEGFLRPRKRRKGSPNWEDEKGEAELPDMELFGEDIKFVDIPRLCVERASPLVCVNQDIVSGTRLSWRRWCGYA
jgi:DNA polymerase mu